MFTQRDRGNEGGALMIEAIALLGLMTMMSPMVVRQTAERTSEMEEVAVAGQMKELKDAVNNYISAHYNTLANQNQNSGTGSISAADLAPFLSAGALDGNAFRGNKLVDGYNIGYRYDCTEYRAGANNIPCFGATCSVSAATPCVRHRITALIVSNGDAIDDRRASRIASMIGADGGYVRSDKLLNSLGQASDQAEKNKILGSQGMWEGSVTNYGLSNISTGGQIAATTVFSSGASGDFLYRKQVDGIPDANSMFTDLDMGGANQNCSGPNNGCHKINNAGGLEVVNGRIIIRSANNNLPPNQEGQVNNDPIALDRDNVVMNVTRNVAISAGVGGQFSTAALNLRGEGGSLANLTASNVLISAGGDPSYPGGFTNIRMDRLGMDVSAQQSINLNSGNAKLQVASAPYSGHINLIADDSTKMWMFDSDIDLQADESRLHLGYDYINMNTSDISLNASNYLNMNADEIKAKANYSINMSVWDDHTYLSLNDDTANLKGGQSASVSTATAGLSMSSDDEDYASLYAGDGDVSLDLDGDAREMFGQVKGTGTNKSTFALTPTSYNLNVGGGAAIFNIATFQSNSAKYGMMNLKIGNRSDQSVSINIDTRYSRGYMNVKASDRIELAANGGDYHSNGQGNARLTLWGDGEAKLASTVLNDNSYRNGSSSISAWGATAQLSATRSGENSLINAVGNRISFHVASGNSYYSQTILFTEFNGFEVGQASHNTTYGPSSWNRAKISVSENGIVTAQNAVGRGWLNIDYAQGNSDYAPYNTHKSSDGELSTFRVNPAFTSVMNDIKLTSRGGARLSEALPNYILKGIYVLTNSYTKGGWPCNDGNSQCKYSMPKYTPEELGLTQGGYEYRCADASNHPHQGTCDNSHTDYVTFNYSDTDYDEICSFTGGCWAHPFLGVVPAPGRSVNYRGSGALHAQDEGVCPDGYQAVMTLTPSVFELGRVSHINYRLVDGANQIAFYEPGFQNFTEVTRDQVNIMQAGTKLGVYTAPICGSGSGTGDTLCPGGGNQVHGWAIAMGTVTQDPTDNSGNAYVWNVGGIPAGSWSAIAHTYCYFNPARFTMPNMKVDGGILRSMNNLYDM